MKEQNKHQPRKRFGQNFLHDQSVIQRIVDVINPQSHDHVVEIGPGKGAITSLLLPKCKKLDVIELDRDLIPVLANKFTAAHFHLHNADALRFDYCNLAYDNQPIRLVGNLPYNISTPLLFHLLEQATCIKDMHFMLQKEVVDRIVAAPGNKTYGRLSVAVQARCKVQSMFTIGPGAFFPSPKIDSAILRLNPDVESIKRISDKEIFDRVVQQAFSQRRKTLRNTLKDIIDSPMLESVGIDPSQRAETVSVKQFVTLANLAAQLQAAHT